MSNKNLKINYKCNCKEKQRINCINNHKKKVKNSDKDIMTMKQNDSNTKTMKKVNNLLDLTSYNMFEVLEVEGKTSNQTSKQISKQTNQNSKSVEHQLC